jgi:RNA polymerase sigma-70 factor, ECF subfamily
MLCMGEVAMYGTIMLKETTKQDLSDEQIITRVVAGETALYELLVRRYNQRLYRVVRAVLREDTEAEDVMQEAFVRAFQHLADFAGHSSFSTWLIKIGVHEGLARVKRKGRTETRDFGEESMAAEMIANKDASPERLAASAEARTLLEQAILTLPEQYRLVLVMRDVEEMSTTETANALEMSEENVKVRLHRARAMVRKDLYQRAGATSAAAFEFHAVRCDRVTSGVMKRIGN